MFSVIAGIASIIGLAVSILTLRVAAGAKKAANQAREAVRRDSAAEEFRNLSRDRVSGAHAEQRHIATCT